MAFTQTLRPLSTLAMTETSDSTDALAGKIQRQQQTSQQVVSCREARGGPSKERHCGKEEAVWHKERFQLELGNV